MTDTYKIGRISFDKRRTQTGIILVLIGLPIVFSCMYFSIVGMNLFHLDKLSPDSLNINDKASIFAIFLIFPFGFGFAVSNEIASRIVDKIQKLDNVKQ